LSFAAHRGKTDDWPMMSRPTDVFNDYFVCYQDLSEYVGLANIERGFHGEPALNKYDGIFINTAVGGVGLHCSRLPNQTYTGQICKGKNRFSREIDILLQSE
jgi:hypothetical protein